MKSRFLAVSVASLLLLVSWPVAAGGEELSGRELKKLQKQAGKAFDAGRIPQAVELYEQILAATAAGDSRRADALYAVAMAHLSPDPPPRAPEAARPYLDELAASFPRHPRRLEIAAARTLLDELQAARAEVQRAAELAESRAESLAALETERQEIAGESEAAGGRVRSLEAQLRKAQGELAAVRAELEKKEEALQKLKSALVGRAGGSG
jgi:hypothetical protein